MDNNSDYVKEGKTGKTQLVVAFILGLIVGVLVAPTFFGYSDDLDSDSILDNDEIVTEDTDVATGLNSVTVSDQLAGDRVLIKEITFAISGWAVVHEDIGGFPGNALGAQRFDIGSFENGYIDLLRNTENNKLYYVILYEDKGNADFDIKEDTPIMVGENSVSTTFETITIDRKNN